MDGLYNSVDMSTESLEMDSLHNVGPNAVLPSINQYWEENINSSTYKIDEAPNLMSIIFMDKDEAVFSHNPYRQFFISLNGSLLNDRFDFSVGYDLFDHIAQWGFGGNTPGMTRNNYNFDMDFSLFFAVTKVYKCHQRCK